MLLLINQQSLKDIVRDKASKNDKPEKVFFICLSYTTIQILINRFVYQLPEDRNL
jgi:hypothetical protein